MEAELGAIDGMVASAGIAPPQAAATMDDEIGSRCMDVNLNGMFLSDGASFVNGAVLAVDGGTSAGYFTRWNGADLGWRALLEAGGYAAP